MQRFLETKSLWRNLVNITRSGGYRLRSEDRSGAGDRRAMAQDHVDIR
jgi:hypothetical protein